MLACVIAAAGQTLLPNLVEASAFSSLTSSAGNSFALDTLQPPTGLSVSVTCTSAAAPAYRAGATAMGSGSNNTLVAITVPASVAAGDLLLVQVVRDAGNAVITPPSGWTLVRSNVVGTSFGAWVYQRTATAGDHSTTYTWTSSLGPEGAGSLVAYSGVDTVTPVDVDSGTGLAYSGTTLSAPSLTTTVAPTRLVAFFGILEGGTVTPPSGMTQRQYVVDHVSSTATDKSLATSGATGALTGTPSVSNGHGVAQALAVRATATATTSLTWTATTSTYATGYELTRDAGAPTSVTPRTATSTTDPGPLTPGSLTTWALTSVYGTWRSTAASTSTTPSCA